MTAHILLYGLISLLIATSAMACSPSDSVPELEKPPIASGPDFEPHLITPEEAIQIADRHLAITSWATTVSDTARENPAMFPAALFTVPADHCVVEFKAARLENANTDSQTLADCHRFLYEHSDPTEWETRHPEEQEGRVRIAVGYLWHSIDPREFNATIMAKNRGIDITRSTEPAYDEFIAAYGPCDVIAEQSVNAILAATEPDAMAAAWLEASEALSACAGSVTEALFKP